MVTNPIVRAIPSPRANGAWDALVPDGWRMDEYRGGGCAALVREWTDPGDPTIEWEVVILVDGDLNLPRVDDPGDTWEVHANYYDDELCASWETYPERALVLPAMREGWPFPEALVDAWLNDVILNARDYGMV